MCWLGTANRFHWFNYSPYSNCIRTYNTAQHLAVFPCMQKRCLMTFNLSRMGKTEKNIWDYIEVRHAHLSCCTPGDLKMQSAETRIWGLHNLTQPDLVTLNSLLYRKLILQFGCNTFRKHGVWTTWQMIHLFHFRHQLFLKGLHLARIA